MTEIKFNVNDRIKVKLTERGHAILDRHVSETLANLSYLKLPKNYSPYTTDESGYTEFQLWDFMNVFGPYFWNGCPALIENNEVVFISEEQ